MQKKPLYLSFTVETNGSNVKIHSMLSIGIVGMNSNGEEIYTFHKNIKPISDTYCKKARKWWDEQPQLWKIITSNQEDPGIVINDLANDLKNLASSYRLKWIAKTAAFEWQWLKAYYETYKQSNSPSIGFKAQCISTIRDIYAKMNNLSTKQIEDEVSDGSTYDPLNVARTNGLLYFNIMKKLGIKI